MNYTKIEKRMIISLLKLTKDRSIPLKIVTRDSKIPSDLALLLIQKWNKEGLILLNNKEVAVNSLNRVKLAIHALELGGDLTKVTRFLDWKEFENLSAIAFEQNGYSVKKNFRFKSSERRWEIDVIGCKETTAVCVDCKHWRYGLSPSSIRRIVKEQVKRTQDLARYINHYPEKIGCSQRETVKLVPAILSLTKPKVRFYRSVPLVAILQLQDFINQLPAYIESLRYFTI